MSVTKLREAAQQALEALEMEAKGYADRHKRLMPAIHSLRAALADGDNLSPTEPVAKVVLMLRIGKKGLATRIVEIDDHLRERLRPGQLLYTAPPQRKPLTEEEIAEASAGVLGLPHEIKAELARAIEQAHGIKE